MRIKCKICKKRTAFMYKLNDGLYCEKCLEMGKVKQKMKLMAEKWKDIDIEKRFEEELNINYKKYENINQIDRRIF